MTAAPERRLHIETPFQAEAPARAGAGRYQWFTTDPEGLGLALNLGMTAHQTHRTRILVALSLSAHDAAFERALALATAVGAELYLLQAIPANEPFSRYATQRAQRAAAMRTRAEAAGIKAEVHQQTGDPAEIIVLHAHARAVDLVVMGRDYRSPWARWRRGSVTEQVLRRTTRPTLVVHSDDTGGDGLYDNVLIAVDMSPGSATLIEAGLQLRRRSERPATIVHVLDSFGAAGDRWMVPEYRGYLRSEARRDVATLVPPGVRHVKVRIASGPAAATIRAHAADMNADLIVMGRSRRFLHLGSVVTRVLRRTGQGLLVIPPLEARTIDAAPPRIATRAARASRARQVRRTRRPDEVEEPHRMPSRAAAISRRAA